MFKAFRQVIETVLCGTLAALIVLIAFSGSLVVALAPAAVAASLGYHIITLLPDQASHAVFTVLPWTAVAGVIAARLIAGRDKFKSIAMTAAAFYMYAALAFYGLALVGVTVYYAGMFASELIKEAPLLTASDLASFAVFTVLFLLSLFIPATGSTLGDA